jgi:serine/threonine protein phosphatase PrpC
MERMPDQLQISLGQFSDKGRKETNQDFHGACIPVEPQLSAKGIVVALADGISTSTVSHAASQAAVRTLLEDYYCTSPAWSVKKSARQVLMAANSWLHAQTHQSQFRYEQDRGYVCTLSALILKSATAYLFHVGDARIQRVRGERLEQLTQDHRLRVSPEQSYLSRALGMDSHLEIDYQAIPVERGDVFMLTTDGVHEHVTGAMVAAALAAHPQDLDSAARAIAMAALEHGSDDNLTIQLVRVERLPVPDSEEIFRAQAGLSFPGPLQARAELDGYRILRELHVSARSRVYLAAEGTEGPPVVIKTLATELQADAASVDRFLLEDWIARRINNAHVVRPVDSTRPRTAIYTVTEYIDGITLAQWMRDHPKPTLETVRGIIEQIADGLNAFHRLEMLHQDLRPANVMIDRSGTVKIIDFGATRVAGVVESFTASTERHHLVGTAQYAAPEYFLGEAGTTRSDQYSLAVIAYQMLSGRLPYGAEVPKAKSRAAQRRLTYRSVLDDDREIPRWFDEVLHRATAVDPAKRYDELSEFVHELRHPSQAYLSRMRPPLLERNPVAFWRGLSVLLMVLVVYLLYRLAR